MTPDKVEAALDVLRAASETLWDEGYGTKSVGVDEALATLTSELSRKDDEIKRLSDALAERERDAARLSCYQRAVNGADFPEKEEAKK